MGWGGKECVRNVVGQTSWDMVSQSTNEGVGDDFNMILSHTSFLSFDLIQVMCGASVKAFDLCVNFCVA